MLAPTGWQWLGERKGPVFLLMGAVLLMVAFGKRSGLRLGIGIGAALIALGLSGMLMMVGFEDRGVGSQVRAVEYAAPVVKAGTRVVIELANIPLWRANFGAWVWICLSLAAAAGIVARIKRLPFLLPVAMILAAAGLLSIRDGAAWFFAACSLAVLGWWLPALLGAVRSFRGRRGAVAAAASAVALIFIGAGDARAAETKPAESMVQDWRISNGRLRGSMEVVVRGAAGDRFLLLTPPAVLGGFNASGMKIVKAPYEEAEAYFVELTAAGRASGRADFEMPLVDPAQGWSLPGGPAVMRQVTVRWNEKGWEFFSENAARTSIPQDLAEGESGARFVLQAMDEVTIQARPKQRNTSTEETKFFAEVSNFFIPGPGVVTGRHRVSLRPSQGRVSLLAMKVPDGFTVSDVKDGPVGSWRFDPEKRELRVTLESGQEQAFAFTVESQRGSGALPVELSLEPLRVVGAASEVGYLALGFGEEAQPESVETVGLSKVNPDDFDSGTGKAADRSAKAEPARIPVQHAFRYGAATASAKVKVIAVAPELRAESSQLVSLGEDRLIIAEELVVNITRAGVFKLVLSVPEGLEVETATGEGLSHWTDSGKGKDRSITLQLSGKTMGRQVFNLTLTGAAVTANSSWTVPRISLRDASRETGVLTVVPERGLQVRAVDRRNVSQLDPRQLASQEGDAAKAAARPGALAYRLLQGDWSLGLGISKLDPWVTAQVFHEATLREGQVLTHISIGYKIENAALKALRIRIPGLDADSAATVRATGPAVADLVPVSGEEGLWEIRFQRGIAGETKVELEYQRRTGESGKESIQPVALEQVRQSSYFVAIRSGGRLEVEADSPPRSWQRADWSVVQGAIGASSGPVAPLMSFRVADPEGPLPVILKRHDLADLRKLRVSEGILASLISPQGESLTSVILKMETAGKGTLRLRLPKDSQLFNVFVNDEGVNLVREGDEWLFHVFPSPVEGQPASVRFVYSASGRAERLEGPRLDVPMENLSWRVFVPDGWKLSDHGGDFDLQGSAQMGMFRLEDYQSFVNSKRASDSREAVAMLDQANVWLQKGEQGKASVALDNAVRSNLLDQASNEDARVQLRQLKTQQAVLGLNTRRQKLVLDQNAGEKEQMEKAAEANPVLRGDVNYDPRDFDRFTAGNTADENAALKEIANRIVSQQLAAEPAPAALEVTLPERGAVHTFSRSVQVDGGRAMAIELGLEKENSGGWWMGLLACGLLGLLGGSRRKAAAGAV